MTDKEVKRLSRSQLIEIIYQLQTREEELTEKNKALTEALESKRIQLESAGNIAEAALALNGVFQSAQNAAAQYLSEIQRLREASEAEARQRLAAAEEEARQLLQQARDEAAALLEEARREQHRSGVTSDRVSDSGMSAILRECRALFEETAAPGASHETR